MDHNTANEGDALQQPSTGQQAGITMTPELFEGMVSGFAKFTGDINQARQLARETVLKPILQKAGVQDVTDIMANLEHVFGMGVQPVRGDNQAAEATIQALKQENQTLRDEKQKMQTRIDILQNGQSNLNDDNEGFQKQVLELVNENEKLGSDVRALQADNENLQVENQTLHADNENLQTENQALQGEDKTLREDNETLRGEQTGFLVTIQENEDQKVRLQTRIDELKKTYEDLERNFEDLREQNKDSAGSNSSVTSNKRKRSHPYSFSFI
ncbi:hypothetical protein PG991_006558 [Apiospora marii]|uniref:Uncharacterized protein n=2 Tax=Apiospora marii TaxID=335849 RepID=A0ABR1RZG6_9PEZI